MEGGVGVAATAAQLATICVTLLDLIKKIKGASSTLKKYQHQFNELRSISDSISTNPLLQTPEVGNHTQNILSIIDKNCLSSLLQQGRILRTLGFVHKEKGLLEIFATLEHYKSSLSLIIEDVQARALYQIQSDLRVMASVPTTTTKENPNNIDLSKAGTNSSCETLATSNTLFHQDHCLDLQMSTSQSSSSGQSSRDGQQRSTNIPFNWGSHQYWKDCTARSNGDQTNGISIEGDFVNLQGMQTYALGGSQIFDGCVTYGSGLQVNGIKVKTKGSNEPLCLPLTNSLWVNCSSKGEGELVNGLKIIFDNKDQ